MKQILISVFIFLFSLQLAQGQRVNTPIDYTPQQLHDIHIQKYKANKTSAWILLGLGTAIAMGGLSQGMEGGDYKLNWSGENKSDNKNDNDNGRTLLYVGSVTAVLSIPLFIAASNHKRKAMMSLKGETITFNNDSFNKNYMAVALTFSF